MRSRRLLSILLASSVVGTALAQAPAAGRDWFVRPGAAGGDGSLAKPFADPWEPLAVCEAGDRVHVAAGTYTGRLGTGTWTIPFDRVALFGGYDADFRARDPWRNATRLAWDAAAKNWPKQERLSSLASGVVVDGFVVDMQDQNGYVDDARTSRAAGSAESALRFALPAVVRNCVLLNPGLHAIVCPPGSTIENNLVVNALVQAIVVHSSAAAHGRTAATLASNTVMFVWDADAPGKGGYGGTAITSRGPAVIRDNLIVGCDNHGIQLLADPSKVAITGNVFWQNRFSNLKSEHGGVQAFAADASMELLEEVGLASFAGNLVRDPELAVDPQWLAIAATRVGPPADAKPEAPPRWGEERPPVIPKGIAPAMQLDQALALLAPRAAGLRAGARVRPLGVAFAAAAVSAAAAPAGAPAADEHTSVALASWSRDPGAVHGKQLAMRVARGGVANVATVPAEFDRKQIAGVFLHDPQQPGQRVTGFYRKGTQAERVCDELRGRYSGSGAVETVYVVRGVAYAGTGYPKASFLIESITEDDGLAAAGADVAARPQGRDWFVRAGAAGGDGSRETPFRDPFQALERCEAGDTIHVAEGQYVGRLRTGRWRIDMPHVALLGGYDAAFAARDPWRHPSRLVCPADYQGSRGGYTLEGDADHTGAIVDGFVFDKRLNNVYAADGSLDVMRSDKTEHVWLSRPGCVVRNCTFVNGASGAVQLANGHTLVDNVFVNHVTQTVLVLHGHTTAPCVVRGNTFVFAWDRRPGHGHGVNGSLLRLCSDARAIVENNVFAHADNDALRLETDPRNVVLRGNVFANNLWSNVQHMTASLSIDDASWARLPELGLRECSGNVVLDPQLAVDAAWRELHRAARGAVPAADAPTAAAPAPAPAGGANPFDTPAPGGEPAPAPVTPAAPPGGNPFDPAPAGAAAAPSASSGGPLFAPAYDWKHALTLVPQAAACSAGARPAPQPVAFTGVARVEPVHEYTEVAWDVARDRAAWDRLVGQRVVLVLAINRLDNQNPLAEAPAAQFQAFVAGSPAGDAGLPLRCYVRRGTRHERAVTQAKGYSGGRVEELHRVMGVVHENRQLLVERVERDG